MHTGRHGRLASVQETVLSCAEKKKEKKKRTLNPSCWSVERSRRLLTTSLNDLKAPPCFREPVFGTAGLVVAAGIAARGVTSVGYVCYFHPSSGARRPPVHSQCELESKNVGTEFQENSGVTSGCSDWSETKNKNKIPKFLELNSKTLTSNAFPGTVGQN